MEAASCPEGSLRGSPCTSMYSLDMNKKDDCLVGGASGGEAYNVVLILLYTARIRLLGEEVEMTTGKMN